MEAVQDNRSAVLQRYNKIKEQYYRDMSKAAENEELQSPNKSEDKSDLFSVIQKYSKIFEAMADTLLGEKFDDTSLLDIVRDDSSQTKVYVDLELTQYITDNAQALLREGVIRKFDTVTVECLCCNKKIKGIGIMDWKDAGTNAICLDCADSNVYVGEGIYFTKFC